MLIPAENYAIQRLKQLLDCFIIKIKIMKNLNEILAGIFAICMVTALVAFTLLGDWQVINACKIANGTAELNGRKLSLTEDTRIKDIPLAQLEDAAKPGSEIKAGQRVFLFMVKNGYYAASEENPDWEAYFEPKTDKMKWSGTSSLVLAVLVGIVGFISWRRRAC